MDVIFKLYEGLVRLGPGSEKTTLRALNMIKNELPKSSNIIDIGCGCGAQTLTLAENIPGKITAIDIYQPYLDSIHEKYRDRQLRASITTLRQDMGQLSFPQSSFDLVWSEGAIYLVGVENGIRLWKNFLTPNGYIAFSEISWFKRNPPADLSAYWSLNYPELKTVTQNMDLLRNIGFKIIDHFPLPSDTWWENYYVPLMDKIVHIQKQSDLSKEMNDIIEDTNEEIELFRNYSEWYGYEFYIIQKLKV